MTGALFTNKNHFEGLHLTKFHDDTAAGHQKKSKLLVHKEIKSEFSKVQDDKILDKNGEIVFEKKVGRGKTIQFPMKLHKMLDDAEKDKRDDIVGWNPCGLSFSIHNPEDFIKEIMPRYFKQTRLRSFQRQVSEQKRNNFCIL